MHVYIRGTNNCSSSSSSSSSYNLPESAIEVELTDVDGEGDDHRPADNNTAAAAVTAFSDRFIAVCRHYVTRLLRGDTSAVHSHSRSHKHYALTSRAEDEDEGDEGEVTTDVDDAHRNA